MGQATLVSAEPVIEATGFGKRYKRLQAVNQVDLTVRRGEIYGLIGPDGAGKSSLMKAIAGVLSFEQGSLDVFGIRIDSEAAAERIKGRLGFMPQGLGLNLYGDLSIEENIDFFAQLRQVSPKQLHERKQKLLAMTRLDAFRDRPMKMLSGGMKQKLGLVCTLIHEPELVILDEPTTGVDPVSRRDFWAILAELLKEHGITALVSTAYMDEASRFHRLSLMYNGQVLATGTPDSICQQADGSLVECVIEPQMAALDRLRPHYPQLETTGDKIRVFVDRQTPEQAQAEVGALLHGINVSAIQALAPELEDAFIALLRRDLVTAGATAQLVLSHFDHALPAEGSIAIEAKQLTCEFGAFRAVDRVDFAVKQGEIFGLLGANGAGKTTAIKMLTGILPPTAGEGRVAGADMHHAGRAIKERIGYMSQAFSLYQDLTVLENIHLYARIYGVSRRVFKQRVDWVVATAGLAQVIKHRAGSLPMGIRQRLALGCALVHQPSVLFLDEPTSGVDPIGRRQFWDILLHLAKVGRVAILVTTHYMSEAEHCDRLALMYSGRIIADDTPAHLIQDLQQEAGGLLAIATAQPLAALELLQTNGFPSVALFGQRLHLLALEPETIERRIQALLHAHGIGLLRVSYSPPTLEDVFVYRVLASERQDLYAV